MCVSIIFSIQIKVKVSIRRLFRSDSSEFIYFLEIDGKYLGYKGDVGDTFDSNFHVLQYRTHRAFPAKLIHTAEKGMTD